jgi:hypothetical protein
MRQRVALGVDSAVQGLPALCERYGLDEEDAHWLKRRLMRFEWTPPDEALCEVALCLMDDGTVERVEGGQGRYPDLPAGAVLPGQVDILWAEIAGTPVAMEMVDGRPLCPPEAVLWVPDYKFGQDRYVATIENNLQTLAYAVMAAKWTGAQAVVPAIIYPGDGEGEWDTPDLPWDAERLGIAEVDVALVLAEAEEQKLAHARGEPLKLVEGRQCEFCASQAFCPAKTALLKSLIEEGIESRVGMLTEEQAIFWATQLRFLASMAPKVKNALQAYVGATNKPIQLGDGVVWGPVEEAKDSIIASQARGVLIDELGDYAEEAIVERVTKTSIGAAIKSKHDAEGIKRQGAATKRRVMAKLGEAGAIISTDRVEWKAHRPRLPEGCDQ